VRRGAKAPHPQANLDQPWEPVGVGARLVMVQKQAKQVFGLGFACRLIRYRYRRRYRTDQLRFR